MLLSLDSPKDKQKQVAARLRARRLTLNMRQCTLSEQSGVPLSTVRRFERTGEISFVSLAKIALVLGLLDDFDKLFQPPPIKSIAELDRLEEVSGRQRGKQ